MKRFFWWLLSGALLALTGWFSYRYWVDNQQTIASYVPDGALLLIESRALHLQRSPAFGPLSGISIRELPLFATAANRAERLATAGLDSTEAQAFLTKTPLRYSLHSVSRDSHEFIFYLDVEASQLLVEKLKNPDPNLFRVLSRQYAGQTIYNLRDLRNASYGFFLVHKNCLIGTPSGILAEQVVRHLKQATYSRGVNFPKSSENIASLYVPERTLNELLRLQTPSASLLRLFLPETITLQFRRSASPTYWLGFAADEVGSRTEIATLFENQTPHRIRDGSLIPSRLASLYHLGLSNCAQFGQAITRLMRLTSSEGLKNRLDRIATLTPNFYEALAGDLILCRFEPANEFTSQVILLEATDVRALSQAIQRIAYTISPKSTVAPRPFLGHQLVPLAVSELPATLLSNLFAGFPQTWITQHDRYVVLGNSEEALQTYLTQVNDRAVWATDTRLNQLMTETLRPAHFTTFSNFGYAGTIINEQWPSAWKTVLGNSPNSNISNLAYQASYGQSTILSTVILGRTTQKADTTVLNKLLLRKRIPFNASLIASPVVVGRLSDPTAQIWAQNSARQFVLLTTEKDKLVQDTTDGSIRSNVIGVDWRKNGKLQYLFLTDRSLYVADLGVKSVQLQRISRPPGLESSLLVRFNGSSQLPTIVALLAHQDGSIYGLDRAQQKLVRLFGNSKKSPLLLPFQIINQGQSASVLALQENRWLNRWPDNATVSDGQVRGYPALIGKPADSTRLGGPALWLPNENQTVAITTSGTLLKLDKTGVIISQKQLYRPLRGGQFRLFPDTELTSFVLLRTTDTDIAVLDAAGNRLVELRNLKPEETHLQFHQMGNGVSILAVKSGNFTTLYTLTGQQIGDRPIPSLFPVTLQYNAQTNELYIVSCVQKAVQLFTIRIQ